MNESKCLGDKIIAIHFELHDNSCSNLVACSTMHLHKFFVDHECIGKGPEYRTFIKAIWSGNLGKKKVYIHERVYRKTDNVFDLYHDLLTEASK